jgi:hypothetical protein
MSTKFQRQNSPKAAFPRKALYRNWESAMKHLTEAEQRLGFRIHATVFAITIIALLLINAMIGPPYWALWVLFGWGVGLLCHWFFVLGPGARKTLSR